MKSTLSLVLLLALAYARPARAQEFANATDAARQTNEAVEFQDDVKAVSYSRSTKGYYLSFGAPYPRQTLSVWVPQSEFERLPMHHSLVGRTVRINGKITTSPTGPLINLEAENEFFVLETDEAILSKPTLDGRQERAAFQSAVSQTFHREDFATLETLGQELAQSHERLADGSWLSAAFFGAFRLSGHASIERFQKVAEILGRWERARPASTLLPLIWAGYHTDLAWKWRGAGWAKDVPAEGFEKFKSELALARQILETHPATKIHPEYFVRMQTIALGQGWPRKNFEQLFSEAISAQPDYDEFYCRKAVYLLPRWSGAPGDSEKFAEDERQSHGAGGAGDALYARIATELMDYYPHPFRDSGISWEELASGYQYLIRQHPDSRYLKSVYAKLAWKAGDRAKLRAALRDLGSTPDMTVWVNLENVALAQKFADAAP